MLNTYLSYQLIARDIPKSLDRIERQPMVDRETKYYLDNITKVKSVDEFVNDTRLFNFAMKAFGLGDMDYAKAFMAKALNEGVEDPDSFANKLTDKRYAEFVRAFNFVKRGEDATVYSEALHGVVSNYALQVELGHVAPEFAFTSAETSYYLANISAVKSIDDLMGDQRLLTYAMAAFGLDAESEAPEKVRQMLEGGIVDPQSAANTSNDKRYVAFVTAFDFAGHGDQATAREEVLKAVPTAFVAQTGMVLVKPGAQYIKAEAEYYAANIGKVKSIDDLLKDNRLLTFAMAAYGLDAATETPKRIREMLAGGVADPASPANKLVDKSYAAFVSAFNFAEYGEQTTTRAEVLLDTSRFYTVKSELGLIKPTSAYVQAESAYYLANIGNVKSIDDLMADQRLYSYAVSSFGFDPATLDKNVIRKVLEGGVRDPDSYANQQSDMRFAAFARAFDFEAHGEDAIGYNPAQKPVIDKYMRQTLEEDAGQNNEGVRLALYFQRKGPTLTSWYEVLADKALASVVRTAFGLPDSMAAADIDKQVQLFERRMDIADFADPQKLEKFITRFTSLYEINNPTSTVMSSVSVLFAQPPEIGVSTDLLMAMQQLKF